MGSWLGVLRPPLAVIGIAGAGGLVLHVMRKHRFAAFIGAGSVILVALGRIPTIFLLLASGAFLWSLIRNGHTVPATKGRASIIRQRLDVWITLVFASLVTTFAVLPSYTVQNTLNPSGMNLPAGLVDSTLFAGLSDVSSSSPAPLRHCRRPPDDSSGRLAGAPPDGGPTVPHRVGCSRFGWLRWD